MHCVSPILGKETAVRSTAYGNGTWDLVQCQESGFVFLLNPPSYAEVADEYAWEKTFQDERKKRQQQEPWVVKLSDWYKTWRTRVAPDRDKMFALAQQHVPTTGPLKALDVGSGEGHRAVSFCEKFRTRGVEVIPYGIEISEHLARTSRKKLARLGGSVIKDNALNGISRFPAETFDVVLMSCYLEHEAKPLDVLCRTHGALKRNGLIIVKVPNFASFNRVYRGSRWCGFRFPDHVNYFTPATLRVLAERAGYEMLKQGLRDCLPTSDNMYAVLRKRPSANATSLRHAA